MAQFYVHTIVYQKETYVDVLDKVKLINDGVLSSGDAPTDTTVFNLFGTIFQKMSSKDVLLVNKKDYRFKTFDVDELLYNYRGYNADSHKSVKTLLKNTDFTIRNTLAISTGEELCYYSLLTDIESDKNMYNIRDKLPTFKYRGRVYTFLNAVNEYQDNSIALLIS